MQIATSQNVVKVLALFFAACLLSDSNSYGQKREEKIFGDKKKFESMGLWHYNDLDGAFKEATEVNKPVLVVLRCLPCEECVKLDDELLESSAELQSLLKSFIRVRVVGTNGLDLSMFQFDTDQSFAVFIFGPDKTLYGRYGTRSDRTAWEGDVSVEGLYKGLLGALDLHRNYPANKTTLIGKQAEKPMFATPNDIPDLAGRYGNKIDYHGAVVKSCIHCHQIGDAMRQHLRSTSGKLPDEWLYPYPHPKTVGLIMDAKEKATVASVSEMSLASSAGFQAGDQIEMLQGQPILSIADMQWVFHHVPTSGGSIEASVRRGDQSMKIVLNLKEGWRAKEDISWRVSTWGLRRAALGGMVLHSLTSEERSALGVNAGQLALKVGHVGAYAPHDRAKKAGVVTGDILTEYDGRTDFFNETELLAYALNTVELGKEVRMKFRRGGEIREVGITTAK